MNKDFSIERSIVPAGFLLLYQHSSSHHEKINTCSHEDDVRVILVLSKVSMTQLPRSIKTERLVLRQINESDAPEIHAELLRSYRMIAPWVDWLSPDQGVEDRIPFIRQAQDAYDKGIAVNMGLWIREGDQLAGIITVRGIDWKLPSGEVGYWGAESTAGKGFISEALRAVSDYFVSQLGFARLWLTCEVTNIPSRRVAERSDFALEGQLRNARRTAQGNLSDVFLYSKVCCEEGAAAKAA